VRWRSGLLVILAAIVIGLAEAGIPSWLSALIVGIVTIGVGYAMVNNGLANLKHTGVLPKQAIEEIKESAKWTTRQGA